MRKRLIAALLAAVLLLTGCSTAGQNKVNRYNASFLNIFDTVTTIVGYAETEDEFKKTAEDVRDKLLVYHQLFDIYNDYAGIANLKTINDNAGVAPVKVDQKIIDLLKFCRDMSAASDGAVNIAMGSVLSLWHDAREAGIDDPDNAVLPDKAALAEAATHTSFDTIIIDEAASTVYISDPAERLDVGAVAKGWAVERVCEDSPDGLLVSVGGNVKATGPKADGTDWVAGIQNPDDANAYLNTVYVRDVSVVTSGDYQRYYTVGGVRYHHIIDQSTLFPASYWRSVTILCRDSGLADALSTALFTLPQDKGQALLDKFDAEALWMDMSGQLIYSPGFKDYIKN